MSADAEWSDDDLRAQLRLESRLRGWQVYRVRQARWVRGVKVPAGSYYAVHWRLAEPPVVAGDLVALEAAVNALTEPGRRSIMTEVLPPDQVRQLQVSEGRWFLPGTPP
jgi:hypothetical protein